MTLGLRQMFASLLVRDAELSNEDVIEYDVSPDQLPKVQRFGDWATRLRVEGQE